MGLYGAEALTSSCHLKNQRNFFYLEARSRPGGLKIQQIWFLSGNFCTENLVETHAGISDSTRSVKRGISDSTRSVKRGISGGTRSVKRGIRGRAGSVKRAGFADAREVKEIGFAGAREAQAAQKGGIRGRREIARAEQ